MGAATEVFIDTAGWIALVSPRDDFHLQAKETYARLKKALRVTTDVILVEIGDTLRRPPLRPLAVKLIEEIRSAEVTTQAWLISSPLRSGGSVIAGPRFYSHLGTWHSCDLTPACDGGFTPWLPAERLGMAEVVHVDRELLEQGFTLFQSRLDKEWSLTDCISFAVMQKRGIWQALTTDHHFEQAGFERLLKPER